MQSFGFEHLVADAKAIEAEKLKAQRTAAPTSSPIPPPPPSLPLATETTTTSSSTTTSAVAAIVDSDIIEITLLLTKFAHHHEGGLSIEVSLFRFVSLIINGLYILIINSSSVFEMLG